jgi:hypothetical protein
LIQVKAPARPCCHDAQMAKSFSTFALTAEQIAVVFPLVNATAPEIDLARWRSFAAPLTDGAAHPSSGAIGLRNEAGYACGLLIYRVERDLRRGAVLAIDLFVALDLVKGDDATRALLQVAETKASELHCSALHIRSDLAQKALCDRLTAAGHRREASLFFKEIAADARPS